MRVSFVHLLAVVVAGSGIAAEATAQVLQLPRARRAVFATSVWAGYVDPGSVADGRTGTDWIFSDGLGWRGSLEYGIGRGTTLGIVGSFTRLPLEVRSRADASTREAEGDILSLEALFHAGGEIGLHQVIEVSAGVREFRNFRADGTGEKLGPVNGDRDLTFALGYGFGFGFSSRAQIALVQDFGYTFHQRDGLPASSSRTTQHRSTRVGLRIRLGG